MLDHSLIQRLKKSSCWGINLELTNVSEKKDTQNDNITPKFQSNSDIQKIIELLNNNKKSDDIKIDIKDDKV